MLATELFGRLDDQAVMAKQMTLELKTSKFELLFKQHTFHRYIYNREDIQAGALKLLEALWPIKEPTRLIGIKFNNIRLKSSQAAESRTKLLTTTQESQEFDRARMNASNRKTFDYFA